MSADQAHAPRVGEWHAAALGYVLSAGTRVFVSHAQLLGPLDAPVAWRIPPGRVGDLVCSRSTCPVVRTSGILVCSRRVFGCRRGFARVWWSSSFPAPFGVRSTPAAKAKRRLEDLRSQDLVLVGLAVAMAKQQMRAGDCFLDKRGEADSAHHGSVINARGVAGLREHVPLWYAIRAVFLCRSQHGE